MRRTRFKSGESVVNSNSINSEISQSDVILLWNSGSFVTVWRLPYIAIKYGTGATMLAYSVCMLTIGIAMYIMESSLAQFSSCGAVTLWKMCPLFKGIGISSLILSLYVIIVYNAIVTYTLQYFVYSVWSLISRNIPWLTCGHKWNTEACLTTSNGLNTSDIMASNSTLPNMVLSTQEYFHNSIQRLSSIDRYGQSGVSWNVLMCSLTVWSTMLMLLITNRGQKYTALLSTKITCVSFFLLFTLMVKSLTLPGAVTGLLSMLTLSSNQILNPMMWVEVVVQVLFSLSLCSGQVPMNASFNKFTSNLYRNSILKCSIEVCLSCVVMVTMCSVIGYLSQACNLQVASIIQTDIGTSLVLYSNLIETFVSSSYLSITFSSMWACLCFGSLLLLGFNSLMSQTEGILTNIMSEFNMAFYYKLSLQFTFKSVFCFIVIFFSIPIFTIKGYQILEIINSHAIGIPRLMLCLLQCIIVCYVYGFTRYNEDYCFMSGKNYNKLYKFCLRFIVPTTLILLMLVLMISCIYAPNVQFDCLHAVIVAMQWTVTALVLAPVPVYAVWRYCTHPASVKNLLQPSSKWGPAEDKHRRGRYARRLDLNASSSACTGQSAIDHAPPASGHAPPPSLAADWETRNSLPSCAVLKAPTTHAIAEMLVHYDAKTGLVNPSYSAGDTR